MSAGIDRLYKAVKIPTLKGAFHTLPPCLRYIPNHSRSDKVMILEEGDIYFVLRKQAQICAGSGSYDEPIIFNLTKGQVQKVHNINLNEILSSSKEINYAK